MGFFQGIDYDSINTDFGAPDGPGEFVITTATMQESKKSPGNFGLAITSTNPDGEEVFKWIQLPNGNDESEDRRRLKWLKRFLNDLEIPQADQERLDETNADDILVAIEFTATVKTKDGYKNIDNISRKKGTSIRTTPSPSVDGLREFDLGDDFA